MLSTWAEMQIALSRRLIVAVRLGDRRAYEIAREAGIHPTVLSKLLNGAVAVRSNDPRILALARVLRIPAEACFRNVRRRRRARGRGLE